MLFFTRIGDNNLLVISSLYLYVTENFRFTWN